MRFLPIFLLLVFSVFAGDNDKENLDRAIKYSGKAILAYPIVDIYKGNAEKELYNQLPIDKQYATAIGIAALSFHKKQVTTQSIKSINFPFIGGVFRPDVSYNDQNYEKQLLFNIKWSF
jgi:hypothetical protein